MTGMSRKKAMQIIQDPSSEKCRDTSVWSTSTSDRELITVPSQNLHGRENSGTGEAQEMQQQEEAQEKRNA